MSFPKSQVVDLLIERGQQDKARQAEHELPDSIDPEKYVLELGHLGLNIEDLNAAFGAAETS
ncbi:hypothetical protein [Blastococcus sp. TF02A-26]|uniref:hypothetical protein n=1 Tax=Blastococcus sp. TF02A-26 TaxID=2250577 RepID=UPI000DE90CCE|nr:hypothetical protein [Blastococcus sp. TF02A-26]RBY78853.1 hypothetical protein DQ240_22870 [Blastococcus sp. TF02A-26]